MPEVNEVAQPLSVWHCDVHGYSVNPEWCFGCIGDERDRYKAALAEVWVEACSVRFRRWQFNEFTDILRRHGIDLEALGGGE